MKLAIAPLAVAAGLALAGPAAAQESSGAAAARVLELEDEIRRLNGRIEQLEFELRRVAEDATRRFGDLEYRMTLLEGGDPSLLGDPVPLGQPGGGGGDSTGPVAAISERAALDEGIAAVEAGEYERGRRDLQNFMTAYPDGPLIGEAEFWLGEAWFREGAFRRAATTFLGNVSNRPEHAHTAIAFLHLGQSLERLGHAGEACQTFGEIVRRDLGDPDIVATAEAERRRLGCP